MIKLFGEATGVVNGIIAERVVKCYAFAPPPVFGPLNKIPRWANATTHTFVHYVDMVPRSQIYTAIKVMLAWKKVDEADICESARFNFIFGRSGSELQLTLPDHEEAGKDLLAMYPPYFHVGKILLLWRDHEESKSLCCHVQSDVLDRLILDPSMLTCHLMGGKDGGYMQRFRDMLEQEAPQTWGSSLARTFRMSRETQATTMLQAAEPDEFDEEEEDNEELDSSTKI